MLTGALVGRRCVTSSPAQQDAAGVGELEAGQHAQRGRLAAAARPEQREELALADLEARRRRRDSPSRFNASRVTASTRSRVRAGLAHPAQLSASSAAPPPGPARWWRPAAPSPMAFSAGRARPVQASVDEQRQRLVLACGEEGDHELVDRDGHGEQHRAEHRRQDERQGDGAERAKRLAPRSWAASSRREAEALERRADRPGTRTAA